MLLSLVGSISRYTHRNSAHECAGSGPSPSVVPYEHRDNCIAPPIRLAQPDPQLEYDEIMKEYLIDDVAPCSLAPTRDTKPLRASPSDNDILE